MTRRRSLPGRLESTCMTRHRSPLGRLERPSKLLNVKGSSNLVGGAGALGGAGGAQEVRQT